LTKGGWKLRGERGQEEGRGGRPIFFRGGGGGFFLGAGEEE